MVNFIKNIKKDIKSFVKDDNAKYVFLSIMAGSISFFWIFSFQFLTNKTGFFYFADHLFDLTGYKALMNSDWSLPLTRVDNIFPGKDFSIILLNYMPGYLVPLKIFKSISGIYLINPFPFWYFLCFVLNSIFSGKILQLFKIRNPVIYIISIILIITNPLIINRMVFHVALAAHWLIIGTIYYYFKAEKENPTYFIKLSLFAAFSLYIHPYIAFMTSLIFGFLFLKLFFTNEKKVAVKGSLSYLVIVFSYFLLIFSPLDYLGNSDNYRGKWSAEFNSFFCSKYPINSINERFWCYEPFINYDHEGYAYLGLGIIIASIYFLFIPLKTIKILKAYLPLFLSSLLLLIISFGNHWKIVDKQIFEFDYPIIFKQIIELFRANGRFSWVFYYCVYFFLIISLSKLNRNIAILIFLFVSIFQFTDLNNIYSKYEKVYFNQMEKPEKLISLSSQLINIENGVLHILPDERCFHKENFGYVDDPLIFAIHYLDKGGKLYSTRIGRYSGEFGDREFCNNYSIENEINEKKPGHFVIMHLNMLKDSTYISKYNCKNIDPFLNKKYNPAYCEYDE